MLFAYGGQVLVIREVLLVIGCKNSNLGKMSDSLDTSSGEFLALICTFVNMTPGIELEKGIKVPTRHVGLIM